MRWYIYHQIGCTSSWCCWSRPDTDDKSKEIFLLSFLALVKLDAGWDRSGIGARFLGFMSSPCVWRKPAASAEEPCTPERGRVCSAYPRLCGCARAGTPLPPTRGADRRLLRSNRLFVTWRRVAPCESDVKAPLAWKRWTPLLHPELWWSCSRERCRGKPFLAQHLHAV